MHRSFEQLGFADHLVGSGRSRSDGFFTLVSRAIDWEPIERVLSVVYGAPVGRPSYTPLMHFKIMLLQRWYDLSDPAVEDALNDRKSFARFVGLPIDVAAPDHSSICRFRQQLIKHYLMQKLLDTLLNQIETAGLIVKEGTLVDASLIPSAARPPSAPRKKKKNKGDDADEAADKAETAPAEKPPAEKPPDKKADDRKADDKDDPYIQGKLSRVDKDARWGGKGRRARFGYKLHIAVDADHRIVRRHHVTTANVNDCEIGPDLVCPDGGDHYGDKGYDSARMDEKLAEHGLGNGIMDRPNRHHPLSPAQRRRNRLFTPIRAAVEGVFGEMKQRLGLYRARYLGLVKVTLECDLVVLAFNLKTAALAHR